MARTPSLFRRLRDWILRNRWRFVLAVGLLGVCAELWEHASTGIVLRDMDLLQELFLVGVLLPAVAGVLLEELVRARQRALIDRGIAIDAERYRLSRDIHDSLAQDVSYLHFKLDQIARNGALLDSEDTLRQVDQLCEVAGEAYKRIYDMLALLRLPASTSLPDALLRHAERVARRAQLEMRFVTEGEPCLLSAELRQELLYIFGEMLTNVEKHAHAEHLDVTITWGVGALAIGIRDDGCGFNAATSAPPGHYGLTIMRERAWEMGGDIKTHSRIGEGTLVVLTMRFDPCPDTIGARDLEVWALPEVSWTGRGQ